MQKIITIRLLHLSTPFSWRGGEQQLAYLVEELEKKEGIEQFVMCPKGSAMEAYCQKKGIVYKAIRKISPFNPIFAYQIKHFCQQKNINLLHLHDAHAHTLAVLSASLFGNKTPMILSRKVDFPIRDNWFSQFKYNHPSIRRIVCVSKAIEKIVGAAIQQSSICTTIYDGIDLTRFESKRGGDTSILRKEYAISEQELLIGNVAALADHKDYFTFVNTAEILLQKGVKAKFLLIGGDGGQKEAIKQYIQQKKISKHCILTGFRKDIAEVLPELDLFLMTSKTEGLGSSLLDAYICGVPVVATAAGGIPEIAKHGETALLAPVQDASTLANHVCNLLNNKDLQKKITKNAQTFVQQFSKEKMATQMLAIYKDSL